MAGMQTLFCAMVTNSLRQLNLQVLQIHDQGQRARIQFRVQRH